MYFSYSIGKITFPLSNTKKIGPAQRIETDEIRKRLSSCFFIYFRRQSIRDLLLQLPLIQLCSQENPYKTRRGSQKPLDVIFKVPNVNKQFNIKVFTKLNLLLRKYYSLAHQFLQNKNHTLNLLLFMTCKKDIEQDCKWRNLYLFGLFAGCISHQQQTKDGPKQFFETNELAQGLAIVYLKRYI